VPFYQITLFRFCWGATKGMIKMRLPNGFGSVTKLSGKRRNPWRARATRGWEITEKGTKQLYVNLGCYEKKIQGIQALTAYHNDPDIFTGLLDMYKKGHVTIDDLFALRLPKTSPEKIIKNIENVGTTLEQIYVLWFADSGKYGCASKSDQRIRVYRRSWELCEPIKHMLVSDITLEVMQNLIDESDENKIKLGNVKQLLKMLFAYSIIKNVIKKDDNMVEYIDLSQASDPKRRKSKRLSTASVNAIWETSSNITAFGELGIYIYTILILSYTGLRISELLDLKKERIFLDKRYLSVDDSKTPSGIRLVPISEKIIPFIEFWLSHNDSKYLISSFAGKHLSASVFTNSYWNKLIDGLGFSGMNYTTHSCRKFCTSMLTTKKVDERWIKKIIGHKAQDLTEDVYTEIEIEPLIEAINLI